MVRISLDTIHRTDILDTRDIPVLDILARVDIPVRVDIPPIVDIPVIVDTQVTVDTQVKVDIQVWVDIQVKVDIPPPMEMEDMVGMAVMEDIWATADTTDMMRPEIGLETSVMDTTTVERMVVILSLETELLLHFHPL